MDGGRRYGVSGNQWLKLAEKLLEARDLTGAISFAVKAGESDGSLRGVVDQITAIAQTITAGDLRISGNKDFYAILQVCRFSQSPDLIISQYRSLSILLNPERNHLPLSNEAFRLISEAWQVLSDSAKKGPYDRELEANQTNQKNRASDSSNWNPPQSNSGSFWTLCPYCLTMYEYPEEYEDCALRCEVCKRAITGVRLPMPTMVGEHSYLVSNSPFLDKVRNGSSSFSTGNHFNCNESNGRARTTRESGVNEVNLDDVDDLDEILIAMPL